MGRISETFVAPPLAACRYGCSSSCAAPVTVFWLFGLICIISGFFGGLAGIAGVSWTTIGLGALMWLAAVAWALAVQTADQRSCEGDRRASR